MVYQIGETELKPSLIVQGLEIIFSLSHQPCSYLDGFLFQLPVHFFFCSRGEKMEFSKRLVF